MKKEWTDWLLDYHNNCTFEDTIGVNTGLVLRIEARASSGAGFQKARSFKKL